MPFVSKRQMKFAYANKPKLEAQGWDVDEWGKASKGLKLPESAPKRPAVKPPQSKKKKMGGYLMIGGK
jgi:hypothetical protein